MLDAEGDGYVVGPLVISMGLERVADDGVESTHWIWTPPGQARWVTEGLLIAAEDMAHQDVDD
jgi:hypothetical protein